jgi:hypothetical protein
MAILVIESDSSTSFLPLVLGAILSPNYIINYVYIVKFKMKKYKDYIGNKPTKILIGVFIYLRGLVPSNELEHFSFDLLVLIIYVLSKDDANGRFLRVSYFLSACVFLPDVVYDLCYLERRWFYLPY